MQYKLHPPFKSQSKIERMEEIPLIKLYQFQSISFPQLAQESDDQDATTVLLYI